MYNEQALRRPCCDDNCCGRLVRCCLADARHRLPPRWFVNSSSSSSSSSLLMLPLLPPPRSTEEAATAVVGDRQPKHQEFMFLLRRLVFFWSKLGERFRDQTVVCRSCVDAVYGNIRNTNSHNKIVVMNP